MDFSKQIDIKNMHHAYLIEGSGDIVVAELIAFLEKNNIQCHGNPNFHKYLERRSRSGFRRPHFYSVCAGRVQTTNGSD